jgi:flagellar biosynthesis GTPase FlhF
MELVTRYAYHCDSAPLFKEQVLVLAIFMNQYQYIEPDICNIRVTLIVLNFLFATVCSVLVVYSTSMARRMGRVYLCRVGAVTDHCCGAGCNTSKLMALGYNGRQCAEHHMILNGAGEPHWSVLDKLAELQREFTVAKNLKQSELNQASLARQRRKEKEHAERAQARAEAEVLKKVVREEQKAARARRQLAWEENQFEREAEKLLAAAELLKGKKAAELLEQEQMRMKAYADEHVQRRDMVCLFVEVHSPRDTVQVM